MAKFSEISAQILSTDFSGRDFIHRSADGTTEYWKNVKRIGGGGQGYVYLQRESTTHQLRAVKKIMVDDFCGEMEAEEEEPEDERGARLPLSKEKMIMRELSHLIAVQNYQDQFVKFLGWYANMDFVYITMEYLEHGNLKRYIETFGAQEEKNAADIVKQVLQGLVILHNNHICHRDLKPENVLIASKSPIRVKITDFGISKTTLGTNLRTKFQNPAYHAPEQSDSQSEYTIAVDMWATGCLAHEVLTSEGPFVVSGGTPENPKKEFSSLLLTRFTEGSTEFPASTLENYGVGALGIEFVKRLILTTPECRMPAVEALHHKWLYHESRPAVQTAARNGSYDIMKQLIIHGHSINSPVMCELGRTALQEAAQGGHLQVVKLLLDNGAEVNAMPAPKSGRTALQAAAEQGHFEIARLLLKHKADVNAAPAPDSGRTALQAAAEQGNIKIVRLLLDKGAQINAAPSNIHGRAAMRAAVERGHTEIVRLFSSFEKSQMERMN